MRIHDPKHPVAAFWHATLLATALLALWLLFTTLSPRPASRSPNVETATEIALPQRAAACGSSSNTGTDFTPARPIALPERFRPARRLLGT
jgi:hypothetical protein